VKDLIARMYEQEAFSLEEYRGNHASLQPAYTWVWNAPIQRDEVRKQLDDMMAAGIRTVYILPEPKNFRIYNERIHMKQEYLSEPFFEVLRYALEYALSIGMSCWMYDEGGWPSGSACGQVIRERPELCRKSLEVRTITLDAGKEYQPGEGALAAFCSASDGRLNMIGPGHRAEMTCELSEYYVKRHGGMIVDSLDEEIGSVFVESTHEKYGKYLGDLFAKTDENGKIIEGSGRLPMMFTDEPGAGRYAWPRNFETRFKEKYGYDVEPFLPVILDDQNDADEDGIRARIDYRQLAGELFRDNYFKPIHDWCRRNHVLSTGHLDIDHLTDGCLYHNYGSVLNQLREMDVPGIDVIWRQIQRPEGEEPPCREGNGFFPRFASSAAVQRGGKYAVSESFAVYGAGLVGEEMRYVINYQLVRGINLFNFMSASYGKTDAVPAVMRPAFVSEMPGYAHLKAVNDYTARACYLMQLGESGVRTALYLPNRDIWAGGKIRENAIAEFDRLGREMEARQIEFDIIDDDGIRMARRVGGELHLGNARYACVIVPECSRMPEDVREKMSGMKQEAVPAVICDCASVRIRTRIMEDGSKICMLFNESGEEQTINATLPGNGFVYRLDAENARTERTANVLNDLTLVSGEALFYLCADRKIDEAEEMITGRRAIAVPDRFAFRKKRDARLDERGIHDRVYDESGAACRLGCWQDLVGRDYSGEAIYTAELELKHPLEAGKLYELELGRVECSARAAINGHEIGIAWAEPKRILFDGRIAQGERKLQIEIEVANTLANQFSTQPLEKMYPASELGPYQDRLNELEADAPIGGLYGPVVLNELIQ